MSYNVSSEAMLRYIYTGPVEAELNERLVGAVDGELRISRLELKTAMTDEGAFTARLSGYLQETVDAMGRSVLDYIPTWDWPSRTSAA